MDGKAGNIVQDSLQTYEAWVAKNPNFINEVETTARFLSYFLVSRFSESRIASEFVYSAANLLALYHDRIIARRATQPTTLIYNESNQMNKWTNIERVKLLLTVLEHCDVLVELSVERLSGVRGKWLAVTCLQVLRCSGRLMLLRHSNENMITMPPIPRANRNKLAPSQNQPLGLELTENGQSNNSFKFQLKRSGRIVRKVEGAPPLQFRDFNIFSSSPSSANAPASLNKQLRHAEYIYIAKPLLHLSAMYVSGSTKSWLAYSVSLGLELTSLRMVRANWQYLNPEQRAELSRRLLRLVLYMMRSPFYDRFTQARLIYILRMLSKVPLLSILTKAILEYLALWQNTYFQLWGH